MQVALFFESGLPAVEAETSGGAVPEPEADFVSWASDTVLPLQVLLVSTANVDRDAVDAQ